MEYGIKTHGLVTLCRSALLSMCLVGSAVAEVELRYLDYNEYPNNDYFVEVLEAAILATNHQREEVRLKAYTQHIPVARIIDEMLDGRRINVAWGPGVQNITDLKVQTIAIPLLKGLGGMRVMIIREGDQARFDELFNVKDLNKIKIGQDQGWADTEIYRSNGVAINRSESFESLFRMLARNRHDAVPMGADHVIDVVHRQTQKFLPATAESYCAEPENKSCLHQKVKLTFEKNKLIYYPLPFYFFVQNDEKAIAERLEYGLRRIIADGTFDRIFDKHYAEVIQHLMLGQRDVISLDNQLVEPQFVQSLHKNEIIQITGF